MSRARERCPAAATNQGAARRIEESGCGRELSTYGIKEFVNIKTVYVAG
jgi:acyl-CoA reductase-like NAD-dependent aldehyde dehydrogenase